jgi:hypothetical protein
MVCVHSAYLFPCLLWLRCFAPCRWMLPSLPLRPPTIPAVEVMCTITATASQPMWLPCSLCMAQSTYLHHCWWDSRELLQHSLPLNLTLPPPPPLPTTLLAHQHALSIQQTLSHLRVCQLVGSRQYLWQGKGQARGMMPPCCTP